MEGREGVNRSGVTVVGSEAPLDYHVAPRSETPAPTGGSTPTRSVALATASPAAAAPAMLTKKKRGRPRKYGPDVAVTKALSAKPISSMAPHPVIDFSTEKRGKVKPVSSVSKTRHEFENLGEWVACSVGASFIPHIISVKAGEDVTMKVISFSQQGPRTICILSANGVISSVTLRQPDSSGGTLTYEGRFEILSLSGSFMPNESGGTRSRAGGMSVSLASPNGRVVGGGVAGQLVAASPVQVVVGSFLTGNQHDHKVIKKHKHEYISSATPTAAVPISSADPDSSFRRDSWSSLPSDLNNKPTDINVSFSRG